MIRKLILCVGILSGLVSAAQTKDLGKDFIGAWKVVSLDMDNGKVHFDMDRDSLFVMDSLRKTWKTKEDSTMVMAVMYALGNAFKDMEFNFVPGGVFTVTTPKKTQTGSFTLQENGVVKASVGKDDMTFIPYAAMLRSEMEMANGKMMVMIFKKVEAHK